MSLHSRRVLVTGAAGFIGSHLTEKLVELGADVRALVRYSSTGGRGWLDSSPAAGAVEIVAGDLLDRDVVKAAVAGSEIVFHLAALIAIPYSYRAPVSYLRVNAEGTSNLLQAAREASVARFVHTSTSEVYGTAQYVPIDEDHPLVGQSPYAASKIAADKMVEAYHRSFAMPTVTVRPFNTYGPRQSARAVIPTIVTQMLGRQDVRLGHLHPTRDFVFVSDTVDGLVRAATASAVEGLTVQLATGHETSIGDLAATIGRLMSRPNPVRSDEERRRPRTSEVDRLVGSYARADGKLSWRPTTALQDGLSQTIAWISAHRDRYRAGSYVL